MGYAPRWRRNDLKGKRRTKRYLTGTLADIASNLSFACTHFLHLIWSFTDCRWTHAFSYVHALEINRKTDVKVPFPLNKPKLVIIVESILVNLLSAKNTISCLHFSLSLTVINWWIHSLMSKDNCHITCTMIVSFSGDKYLNVIQARAI